MSDDSSVEKSAEPPLEVTRFDEFRGMVESEFDVDDSFLEHGVPTFHVRMEKGSKQAFLRLFERLGTTGFTPSLKERGGKTVLKIVRKPPVKPGRVIINVALFFATLGSVLLAGYAQSLNVLEAVKFAAAIMLIMAVHEMGHKIAAIRYGIEASYPYFIPGIPPIGTFGAVIQQKSLPPNKDALFDLGLAGPAVGFMATTVITFLGVQSSRIIPSSEVPSGAQFIPVPILFEFITTAFPPPGSGEVILLHSVAFAGWVGMLVTTLNLVPAGMLDGGHIARSLLGSKFHGILSFFAVVLLIILGYFPFAIIVFFLSRHQHPGSLDDVSKLSTNRKLMAPVLILIFVLCMTPLWSLL